MEAEKAGSMVFYGIYICSRTKATAALIFALAVHCARAATSCLCVICFGQTRLAMLKNSRTKWLQT